MSALLELLMRDHRQIDEKLVRLRGAIAGENWEVVEATFPIFRRHLEEHMLAEEGVLFPETESRHGEIPANAAMCHEHERVRSLLDTLSSLALARRDTLFLEFLEELEQLLEVHNLKEEHILYPQSERILGADADRLAVRLRNILGSVHTDTTTDPAPICGCGGGCHGR